MATYMIPRTEINPTYCAYHRAKNSFAEQHLACGMPDDEVSSQSMAVWLAKISPKGGPIVKYFKVMELEVSISRFRIILEILVLYLAYTGLAFVI